MAAQPSKIAYITGASRGIGKALAELLLGKGYEVVGLSRSNDLTADDYTFQQLDLSDLKAVKDFEFTRNAEEVLLVNNAGSLGEVAPVGKVSDESIHKAMIINTISPQILMNKFIAAYDKQVGRYHILNISSGAGKRPITSWATYCASKAALDLFSETIADEFLWEERSNWYIHSCAPGVVDTGMQAEIRSSSKEKFKDVNRFKALKENNDLSSPHQVAEKLMQVIKNPQHFPDVVISVRDF